MEFMLVPDADAEGDGDGDAALYASRGKTLLRIKGSSPDTPISKSFWTAHWAVARFFGEERGHGVL